MSKSQITPNNQMPRVTFRLPDELLSDLDAKIEDSEYHTRTQFLREQCEQFVGGDDE